MVCQACGTGNTYKCDCSYNVITTTPSQCKSCTCSSGGTCHLHTIEDNKALQKKIWKQTGAAPSMFMGNLTALVVEGPQDCPSGNPLTNAPLKKFAYVNWNQSSDRATPSQGIRRVPTRGNSTRTTITSNRPGAAAAGGEGVDVKHNSYARYLARKKGKVFRTNDIIAGPPRFGNKTQTYNIVG